MNKAADRTESAILCVYVDSYFVRRQEVGSANGMYLNPGNTVSAEGNHPVRTIVRTFQPDYIRIEAYPNIRRTKRCWACPLIGSDIKAAAIFNSGSRKFPIAGLSPTEANPIKVVRPEVILKRQGDRIRRGRRSPLEYT